MWTKSQRAAIEAPVSNILVTAAAGSGKTAVMVERIINRVLDKNGADIDKILVVTYTNAAASEIKERIQLRILKELEEKPFDERLQRQLLLIDNAKICTIHSLCLDIIKKFFYKLNLDATLRIGDKLEVETIKNKAIENVFEKYYVEDDDSFLKLVDEFCAGKKTDQFLIDIVTKIYNFSTTVPHSDKWFEMCCDNYIKNNFKIYHDYLIDKIKKELKYAMLLCENSLKLCAKNNQTSCLPVLESDKQLLQGILDNANSIDIIYEKCSNIKFAVFAKAYKKDMSDFVLEKVTENRDEIKNILKKSVLTSITVKESDFASDCKKMADTVKKLCEIALEIGKEFTMIKSEKNIIDFTDFEHYALKILEGSNGLPSEEAKIISEMFEEIYIDEYQDCNHIQDRIFYLISRCPYNKPNIFMVGDVKQSIYKFRDAAPMLFVDKLKEYPQFPDESGYNKISLSKNFRSRSEILNGVNFIFKQIMSEYVGEIEYNDFLIKNENEEYNDTPNEFKNVEITVLSDDNIIETDEFEENFSDDEPLDNLECEANYIAKKINEIINSKILVYDKELKTKRPVKYKDIVILMRSTSGKANVFESALKTNNIPVFSDSLGSYFTSTEISTLMSLLKIIVNPIDDINLVSVLRSGIFMFDDNELMKIRLGNSFDYFYYSLIDYCQNNDDELSNKISNFIAIITDLKDASRYLPTDELIWYALKKTDYMSYISTLPLAKQKRMNIISLISKASQFEETDYKGIFNFTRFVDDIVSRNSDTDAAKIISENDDVVRIMSIHKSKGLEFAVVFLSQCGKKFNFSDERSSVLCHKELGIGFDFIDYEKRFSYTPTIKKAISHKIHLETLSEEQRILYVALTRAREKLYMVGVINKADKYFGKISNQLSSCDDIFLPHQMTGNAVSYFDWILPSVYRHENNKKLHNIFGDVNCVFDEGSSFVCNIIEKSKYSHYEHIDESVNLPEIAPKKSEYHDEIVRRLEYKYPHETNSFPTNVTVTELKKMFERESGDYNYYYKEHISYPKFAQRTDGAYTGTIIHKILEEIDLNAINSLEDIKSYILKLTDSNVISLSESKLVDAEKIYAFISSKLGANIKKSKRLYREVPFKFEDRIDMLFENVGSEKVIIQGAIDLFFYDENGNLILVDYKTDKLTEDELIKKYNIQLIMYKKALEKITDKKVDKCYIYSFYNNKEILLEEE